MRRAFWAVVVTGVFLLLLSALVVTPEDVAPAVAAPALTETMHAVFAPAMLPPVQEMAEARLRQAEIGAAALCPFALIAYALPRPNPVDANGRVITAVRYENSVYEVFRPEVAGG